MSYDEDITAEEPTVPLRLLSTALDEIYALRRALAYEARGIEVHTELKRFPASRRPVAADQILRMQAAARGKVHLAYAGVSRASLDWSFKDAGAAETLTRAQWEAEFTATPRRPSCATPPRTD